MASMGNNMMVGAVSTESKYAVTDKEELVAAFGKLSDAEKAQFYEDCKNGISPEDARKAMHQKIKELWRK